VGERSAARADDAQTRGKFDIVVPSLSIKAEPPVAWSTTTSTSTARAKQAEAYLRFLYYAARASRSSRSITIARREPAACARARSRAIPKVPMVTIDTRVRRLAEGAADALRRRRLLRSHLSTRDR
jgi:ABC-type sulfate transport system substrate-binding protein